MYQKSSDLRKHLIISIYIDFLRFYFPFFCIHWLMGYHILPADSVGYAHDIRTDPVGFLPVAKMGRCMGQVAYPLSYSAFLWSDALLRRFLCSVALRHSFVHTGRESFGYNGKHSDNGCIPPELLLLRRISDGGLDSRSQMPEPRTRPCGMDDT